MCPSHWSRVVLTALLACAHLGQAVAAAPPSPAVQIDALNRANGAVVGIQVVAADGARSAETLGKERTGSGVVIGPDGLILTIGYLVLEAQTIQVVTQDNRTLPAGPVAYDLATGFGLVRSLLPLRGIAPVPLGTHKDLNTGDMVISAIGGADADVAMTQLVGKRPFSGYWEYHIDTALFTSAANWSASAACSSAMRRARTPASRATCSCRSTCSSRSWPRCSRPAAAARATAPGLA
jgi:serine protease Do